MIAKSFEIVSSQVKNGPNFRLLALLPLSRRYTQEVLAFEETEEQPSFVLLFSIVLTEKKGNMK